jgi:hypothetical protein
MGWETGAYTCKGMYAASLVYSESPAFLVPPVSLLHEKREEALSTVPVGGVIRMRNPFPL